VEYYPNRIIHNLSSVLALHQTKTPPIRRGFEFYNKDLRCLSLSSLFLKASSAQDSCSFLWYKRNFVFFTAFAAGYFCHNTIGSALVFSFGSAFRTTGRRIKTFLFIEILFPTCPNKLLATISAYQSLISCC